MQALIRLGLSAAVAAMLAAPVAVRAQYNYSINGDGSITVTGYTGAGGAVAIPDTLNGLRVTSIGKESFYYCDTLIRITIPGGVTNIGNDAFYRCSSLEGVTMPDTIASIGDRAFYNCTSLTRVTIPDAVTNVGCRAFSYGTSLTNVTIGAGVIRISNAAFHSCTRLTGIYFRSTPPSLGDDVFKEDRKATVYHLPGKAGWGKEFGGRPTALWNPQERTERCQP